MFEADHWVFSSSDRPDLDKILDQPPKSVRMTAPSPISFLTAFSAESLISGLQHKRVAPSVLHHINLLLDELLVSLVTAAQSINPKHLRADGVPQVFTSGSSHESTGIKSLARECTGEAELELRAWYEMSGGVKKSFPPGSNGRGMTGMKEGQNARFPLQEAVDLLRLRISELSSTSPPLDDYDRIEANVIAAWTKAGGDPSEYTIEPAAAWMHAFIERTQEHLCSQLNRVVERDSSSSLCGPGDLYTALAEDERFWGWFARMKVKTSLDEAVKAASKPPRVAGLQNDPNGRLTPSGGSPERLSQSSGRDHSFDSSRLRKTPNGGIESPVRGSNDNSRLSSIVNVSRKTSTMSKRFGVGHGRKDSNLSVSIRTGEERAKSPLEDEDEFDALMRSGETMKVSLTPSRLRTFDSGRRSQPDSPQQASFRRADDSKPPVPVPKSQSANVALSKLSPARQSAAPGPRLPRSQSGSVQKLSARSAMTIDEGSEEDDPLILVAGQQARKKTLKDILASAPAEFTSPPTGTRTTPAVILGAPPSGARLDNVPDKNEAAQSLSSDRQTNGDSHTTSSSLAAQQGSSSTSSGASGAPYSVNRDIPPSAVRKQLVPPSRMTIEDEDGRKPRKMRPEAQELADFLNTAPPPSSSTKQTETATSTKSAKGFRGLMSKVTGSSRKKEEEARLARENALYDIPTASRTSMPKKQRSMASVATVQTSQTAPPSAYKHYGDEPPALPTKLRKRSDTGSLQAVSSGESVHKKSSNESPPLPSKDVSAQSQKKIGNVSAVKVDPPSTRPTEVPFTNRTAPVLKPEGQPIEDELIQSTTPIEPHLTDSSAADDGSSANHRTPDPVPVENHRAVAPVTLAPAIPASSSSPSGHIDRTPSDTYGSQTVDEGLEDQSTSRSESQVEPSSNESARIAVRTTSTSFGAAATPVESAEPTIAISRLLPLRTILQHSTSAGECRMLVTAYLTQIGVPIDVNTRQIELNAEAKVTAWLLDHESGPPIALPWSPPISGSSTLDQPPAILAENDSVQNEAAGSHEALNDEITSSIQSQQASRHQYPQATTSVLENGDRRGSRMLRKKDVFDDGEASVSDTASVASLSRDEEGVPPSYATSAKRSSPVRWSAAGQSAA